ncbi:hypothetical protein WMY93_011709 [Mugilogobius chulae]|uniref:E3 ubiquitin-protein ligase n=1 Tax=Mugilogobius chulae TaxID=88201 RepID=A0AAW0P9G3_9GOBI
MASEEVPMDFDLDFNLPQPKPDYSASIELKVSVWSSELTEPKKLQREISKTLMRWAHANFINGEFIATGMSEDGKTAVISVEPPEALQELLNLSGKHLTTKDEMTFSITPIKPEEQNQDHKKSEVAYSSLKQQKALSNNADVAELKVSVWSPEEFEPKKFQRDMSKTLQSWANKNSIKGIFTATEMSDDGKTAVISVKPAEVLHELLNISGRRLITKENKTFSLTPIQQEEQNQVDKKDSETYSSLKPKKEVNVSVNLKNEESSADDKPCLVALDPYWYIKKSYTDEIQLIEKENGVKINENVAVSFISERNDADPRKASDKFIQLVQSCSKDCSSLSIPFKNVGPEELKETLKMIQMTDHKCQITISPDQITIYGPQRYQIAISKSIQQRPIITPNLTVEERVDHQEKMLTSFYTKNSTAPTQSKLKLGTNIKDPLVTDGLPVVVHYWEIITNRHQQDLDRIKEKFNVSFREVGIAQGIKVIKVQNNKFNGNIQMESQAIRALLLLYQKVATSQFDFLENSLYNPFIETSSVKKPSSAEAKKDKDEEEKCPVCLDTFTNKKKLKCKHEFCEECLKQSVKSQGSICPVCKDVFGLVEKDQPDGSLRWRNSSYSVPAFEPRGTPWISYTPINRPERKSTFKNFIKTSSVKKPSRAEDKKNKDEDEKCPVCLDAFTNKKQLKCKHEFCEECLEQSVKSQGSICPLCKDVFGLVEGDQPKGT